TPPAAASQPHHLRQSRAVGFGSGVGYLVAVLVVDEGRRRLRSKDIPHIFRGLPSELIYIGILSLAIYGLVGTVD
uniref:Rnf-Nqr domain containing protein n=1 Tax=Gemmiger qucibialis TaxID=2997294 RepID=UPI0040299D9A